MIDLIENSGDASENTQDLSLGDSLVDFTMEDWQGVLSTYQGQVNTEQKSTDLSLAITDTNSESGRFINELKENEGSIYVGSLAGGVTAAGLLLDKIADVGLVTSRLGIWGRLGISAAVGIGAGFVADYYKKNFYDLSERSKFSDHLR